MMTLDDFLGYFHFSEIERNMQNAFRKAQIYSKIKNKTEGIELRGYPEIINVRKTEDYDEIDFRLPKDVDPTLLIDKWYIFENYFSQSLKLVVNNNDGFYRVRHFKNTQKNAFAYDYNEIKPHVRKMRVPFLLGKDYVGQLKAFDLANYPTVLIGGITGSGKSALIRAALTTMILHAKENKTNLQLILGDLKRTEFHIFRGIDIVKDVVVTPLELKKQLKWLGREIARRGDLLDKHELGHIDGYNKIPGVQKKPYIFLCIDEVSQISNDKDAMEELITICALGRTLGVYTLLSMQRPCAETLSTRVRANLVIKIAFKVRDKSNSGLILGHETIENASKIKRPGQCYVALDEEENLLTIQVPYLDMADFQVINGKIHNRTGEHHAKPISKEGPILKGAKDLLALYRTKPKRKPEEEKTEQPKIEKLKKKIKGDEINVRPR